MSGGLSARVHANEREPGATEQPTQKDLRVQALLKSSPDLRRATGLTGDEPATGLHDLAAERMSLLPPATRDRIWTSVEASVASSNDNAAGVAAPAADAGPDPAPGGTSEAGLDHGGFGQGPSPDAPSSPLAEPREAAALSPLDDRDYARAQILQSWHDRIEPLLALIAKAEETVATAERVLLDPDATPGEVRGKLGAVNEYETVISREWEGLNKAEVPALIESLHELRLVSSDTEAARLERMIGEIKHPPALDSFAMKREALKRTEHERRADEPRREAERLREQSPDHDDLESRPSPSP